MRKGVIRTGDVTRQISRVEDERREVMNIVSGTLDGLSEGDLVLVPHYFSGEKIPGRMVLARFCLRNMACSFYADQVRVLHRQDREILPFVTQDYEGSQYVFNPATFSKRAVQGYCVSVEPSIIGRHKFAAGMHEILFKLSRTRGYEPHAAALKVARQQMAS